jgi:hypothetical protein
VAEGEEHADGYGALVCGDEAAGHEVDCLRVVKWWDGDGGKGEVTEMWSASRAWRRPRV